jgi:hypothetical protein
VAVGEQIDQGPSPVHRGIGRSMRAWMGAQHGRPGDVGRKARREKRRRQESEVPMVPMKRGNSRGGKGHWFRVLTEEWTRGRLA